MKRTLYIFIIFCFLYAGCTSNPGNQRENAATGEKPEAEVARTSKVNTDSLVAIINSLKEKTEKGMKTFQKKTLKTTDLRAQIKQKWSSVEFYLEDSQVVKIVTIPYKQISSRTEEFYFQGGKLLLANIEDEGLKNKEGQEKIDKSYYYFNDQFIKEDNKTTEKETTIRTSDGERLLQEAGEYLTLVPKK
jgi:hypothetical protein